MTIQTETLADGSVVVKLSNMDDWEEFAADNLGALLDQYGGTYNAYQHAVQGGLQLGGGAVTFGRSYRDNFGGLRVPITVAAINGRTYHGTYFKSAGDYARVKLAKRKC